MTTKTESRLTHLDGCPARSERTESYTQPAPKGLVAHVVRCQDCGASDVTKKGA